MTLGWWIVAALVALICLGVVYALLSDHDSRKQIIDALEPGPLTSGLLEDMTGLSAGAIYVALKNLERQGKVTLEETPATAERGWRPGIRATLVKP